MVEDVNFFKREGADGIVLGCLDARNDIHVENCRRILTAWDPRKPSTFHRAFDETNYEDLRENIDILIDLGFTRILSSGFEKSAEAGILHLKKMVDFTAEKSITIMAGAGVTSGNVEKIIKETGCVEVHASARSEFKDSIPSRLSMGGGSQDLQPLMVCDQDKVREILKVIIA
jgi:copper homeostasis protein